ncbi:MAG: hypothetical protein IJI14_19305 [Anaerolineaceae bacterium]|nr:hypothetical protein [Anaerolineaceae bacterium]
MHSPAFDMFYRNALIGLMNGCLMPWDKDVLSDTPLPSSVIEPYMAKEVPDVRESMRLTYETMVVWIDEARKVNYFSKRFVQLSRMIMTGVTTMGRGLVTLHTRGETLEDVPMSIQDLIGVASYHFRKSHLGVLQTVRTHPEVSERLLMNQISWNNMLMRLFKTRDKLNQKSECGMRISEIGNQTKIGTQNSEFGSEKADTAGIDAACSDNSASLPSGEKDLLLTDAKDEKFDPFKAFAPADRGLSEPAAISEPGAFTTPRAFSSYDSKQAEGNGRRCQQDRLPDTMENRPDNEEGRMKKEEGNTAGQSGYQESEIRLDNEEERMKKEEERMLDADVPENSEDKSSSRADGDCPFTEPSLADRPGYLQILQNVFARSGSNEDGKLTFKFDEICCLAADPDFNHFYPDQAAQMRSILQQIDSS